MAEIPTVLGDESGEGLPVFADEEIAFNGAGRSGCEPFIIRRLETPRPGRTVVFSFCKTEHLPYDLCVQTALIVLKHHFGGAITIHSDGKDNDWSQARETCSSILGYGAEFRLDDADASPISQSR
jgi:hypothetical protein